MGARPLRLLLGQEWVTDLDVTTFAAERRTRRSAGTPSRPGLSHGADRCAQAAPADQARQTAVAGVPSAPDRGIERSRSASTGASHRRRSGRCPHRPGASGSRTGTPRTESTSRGACSHGAGATQAPQQVPPLPNGRRLGRRGDDRHLPVPEDLSLDLGYQPAGKGTHQAKQGHIVATAAAGLALGAAAWAPARHDSVPLVIQCAWASPSMSQASTTSTDFGPGCASVPSSGAGSFGGMSAAPVATAASADPLLSTLVQRSRRPISSTR